MAPKKLEAEKLYTLKVTLHGSKPPIWRRMKIAGGFSLLDLHYAIQSAMGWQNCHLFQFEKDGTCYTDLTELDASWELNLADAGDITLEDVLHLEKDKMVYLYDFGDSWEHEIVVEKIEENAAVPDHPECVTGKRACPVEDSGGISGYQQMLVILADPAHQQRQEILDWVGDDLDPEHFDLTAVNEALQGIALN